MGLAEYPAEVRFLWYGIANRNLSVSRTKRISFTLPTHSLDDLFSSQKERDEAKLAKIREIPLDEIDDFPDHPFQVREDEDMFQLVESLKERGVITPATVRQLRRQLPSQWVFYRLLRDSWLRRTCLLKYTSRLHFAGGWITYQKDIAPVAPVWKLKVSKYRLNNCNFTLKVL